jgi:hypothetical protein
MKVDKKLLQHALEVVRPGLADKEIIEQTTSFAFMKDRVVTYNDEISISHPIPGLDLTGAIQADKLYSLLGKLKKDEIEMTLQENEIILECGRVKVSLAIQSEIKLPLDDVSKIGKWHDLPDNFLKFMSFAMASCSRDMSQPILTTVHVNKSGFIEASDSNRLTRCQLEKELPVKTFLIPAQSTADIVKLKPTKIAEGKVPGWMHFQTNEGTIMSCRIFNDDEYKDTSPYLNVEGVEVTFPASIEEVIDRAAIFAKREHVLDESIDIKLEKNRLKIHSECTGSKFDEEINMDYKDIPTKFSIKPYLLKGILSETKTFILCETRLKFEGQDWLYITALEDMEE